MLKLTHLAAMAVLAIGMVFASPASADDLSTGTGVDGSAPAATQSVTPDAAISSRDLMAAMEGLVGDGIIGSEVLGGSDADPLAHGNHKNPKSWPECNKCKFVKCNKDGFCSGHCRKRKRLFYCSSRHRPQS